MGGDSKISPVISGNIGYGVSKSSGYGGSKISGYGGSRNNGYKGPSVGYGAHARRYKRSAEPSADPKPHVIVHGGRGSGYNGDEGSLGRYGGYRAPGYGAFSRG